MFAALSAPTAKEDQVVFAGCLRFRENNTQQSVERPSLGGGGAGAGAGDACLVGQQILHSQRTANAYFSGGTIRGGVFVVGGACL